MISKRTGAALLFLPTSLLILAAVLAPGVAQPLSYHHFADGRGFYGITNFNDFASNFLFAVFGAWGMWFLTETSSAKKFHDPRGHWPYLTLFIGVLLTVFVSSYFHLMLDNSCLVWERLPMTVAFRSLVSATIAERIDLTIGLRLLLPFLCLGGQSNLQQQFREQRSAGGLRFSAAAEVYPITVLLLLLCLPPRSTRSGDLVCVGVFYLLGKVFEVFTRSSYSLDRERISGHSLRHLTAAVSGYSLLPILQKRESVMAEGQLSHAA